MKKVAAVLAVIFAGIVVCLTFGSLSNQQYVNIESRITKSLGG